MGHSYERQSKVDLEKMRIELGSALKNFEKDQLQIELFGIDGRLFDMNLETIMYDPRKAYLTSMPINIKMLPRYIESKDLKLQTKKKRKITSKNRVDTYVPIEGSYMGLYLRRTDYIKTSEKPPKFAFVRPNPAWISENLS